MGSKDDAASAKGLSTGLGLYAFKSAWIKANS
jgi:hypothetical protein